MSKEKEPTLTVQQRALTQYLDSLLMEIPEEASSVVDAPAEIAIADLDTVDVESFSSTLLGDAIKSDSHVDERPDWTKQPFKALFFNVGEIKLAAPLDKFGGIVTDFSDIKALPGTSSYYLGVILHGGHTVRVIDFERFVATVAEGKAPESGVGQSSLNRIILIEGKDIGIACRDISEVEEIDPSDVRWRTATTKRPWYRGIVIEEMCALLDIEAMLSILNSDQHYS